LRQIPLTVTGFPYVLDGEDEKDVPTIPFYSDLFDQLQSLMTQ
jgi:hypothetical protein